MNNPNYAAATNLVYSSIDLENGYMIFAVDLIRWRVEPSAFILNTKTIAIENIIQYKTKPIPPAFKPPWLQFIYSTQDIDTRLTVLQCY